MIADLEPLVLRMCNALGNGIAQGLLLAFCALLGLRCFRRSSAATRYAVEFAALLTVAALPVVHFFLDPATPTESFSFSEETTAVPPEVGPKSTPASHPPGPIARGFILFPQEQVQAPSTAATKHLLPPGTATVVEEWIERAHEPVTESATPPRLADDLAIDAGANAVLVPSLSMFARALPSPNPLIRLSLPTALATAIALTWLLLAAVRLGSLAWQCLALQQLKRQRQPVPAPIQEQFSKVCRHMRVRRTVDLGIVPDLRSPIAVGFLRPAILLPEALVSSTPGDLDPMLRHELAHVQRRDDWTNLIQQLVKAVLYFHPGVIALSRRLNLDREIACDDHVLAATRTPRDYALFLTDFASRTHGRQWAAAPAAWSNPNQLRERIHMILDAKRNTSPRIAPMRTGILALAALLIAATGIGAAPRLALDATEGPDTTALAASSSDAADVVIVEELPYTEALLADIDQVHVEITTSDSDADLDRPKEKPARHKNSGSRNENENEKKYENYRSKVTVRSSGSATSVTPHEIHRTVVLTAPTPAPHPELAPHPDAMPFPHPPKPARIAIETRAAAIGTTEERNLEERMRRLEKLVESLAHKPQQADWGDPKFHLRFEGLTKSMEQVSKDVERSMRDADRVRPDAFSAEGADKAHNVQRKALEIQRQAIRKQIESMQSQVERLENQLDRLDDQFEKTIEAERERAESQAEAAREDTKERSKSRNPDGKPGQEPQPPKFKEPTVTPAPTGPTPPTPEALIRN